MTTLRPLLLFSGYLGKSATSLLILGAFARLGGAEGAGEFAFAMAVSYPVFIVAELALRNVYQTMHDAPPFRPFFTIRAASLALACVAIAGAALVFEAFPTFGVLGPLLVMRCADSLLDICYGGLQARDRVGRAAGWMWVNNLLTAAAITTSIALGLTAEACIIGSAAASVVVLVPVASQVLRWKRDPHRDVNRSDYRRIVRAGLVLGCAQGLQSLLIYLPTLYLASATSTATVGVFAVCQYVFTLSNMFFSSIQQVSLSGLRKALNSDGLDGLQRRGLHVAGQLLAMGVVGGALSLVMFPVVAPAVFGDEFQVTQGEILPIALSVVVLSADYATMSVQLVLNRYGVRVQVAVVGAIAALAAAAVTYGNASITTAGYVILAGTTGRAAWGAWTLLTTVRSLRETSQTAPTSVARPIFKGES